MGVVITSRKFYCEYLGPGPGGGGVDYAIGNIGDVIYCDIEFYIKWSAENKRLQFVAATDTITNVNDLDPSSFIEDGFRVGDTIVITGTALNNATRTILTVEDRVITVTAGLVDELDEDCSIFGTTPVTALDYYYNLVPNGTPETYLSLQDRGTLQRFTVDGLDATDTISLVNTFIGSDSFAWVTHEPIDPDTGETSQVYLQGQGITADYRQKFKLFSRYINTPMWLIDQVNNFADQTTPTLFENQESLKHIFRIDAKFNANDPDIPHTGGETERDGILAWFNSNANGSRPEYYIDSIQYEDDITTDIVDTPDFNRKTNVTVVVKSRNSLFTTATQIIIGAMYLPMDEPDFVKTQSWMRQNLFFDRTFVLTLSDVATGGDMEATDYQQLKDIDLTTFSPSTATILFSLELSTALRDKLKGKPADNRRDTYWIAIKDPTAIPTTADNQKLALLIDAQNLAYNQDDDTLVELIGTPLTYEYPNEVDHAGTDLAGFEGDPFYTRMKFRVKASANVDGVSPTLKTIKIQTVATHATKDDFVLEEKIITTQQIRKLIIGLPGFIKHTQTINTQEERGFITYPDDPRNRVNLFRVPANDTSTKAAFELQYGMVLRYEYWIQAFPQSEGLQAEIFQDIENVSQRWNNYNAVAGWSLKQRWTWEVIGYDGYVTTFTTETDINPILGNEPAEEGPKIDSKIEFLTQDGITYLQSIVEEGITLVRATFEGDFSVKPTFDGSLATGYYGWLFVDFEGSTGIFSRLFASTEIPSEDDSPWSAPDGDPTATETYADGNLRFNRYDNTRITVEGYLDSRHAALRGKGELLLFPRLGYTYPECLLLLEDGTPVLQENGEGIKLETCV